MRNGRDDFDTAFRSSLYEKPDGKKQECFYGKNQAAQQSSARKPKH